MEHLNQPHAAARGQASSHASRGRRMGGGSVSCLFWNIGVRIAVRRPRTSSLRATRRGRRNARRAARRRSRASSRRSRRRRRRRPAGASTRRPLAAAAPAACRMSAEPDAGSTRTNRSLEHLNHAECQGGVVLCVLAFSNEQSRPGACARFRSRPAFPSPADGRESERRSSPKRCVRRLRRRCRVRELPWRPLLVPRGARFPGVARQARASRGRGLPRVRARLLRPLTIRPPDRPRAGAFVREPGSLPPRPRNGRRPR